MFQRLLGNHSEPYQLVYEAEKKWYVVRRRGVVMCHGVCDAYRAQEDAIRVIALSNMRQVIENVLGQTGWRAVKKQWQREWRDACYKAARADHEDTVIHRLLVADEVVRDLVRGR